MASPDSLAEQRLPWLSLLLPEGSVTIFGADGRVLTTLNAGEIAVVSIDYVTPEEGEHPGTKTEDPEEDPKIQAVILLAKLPTELLQLGFWLPLWVGAPSPQEKLRVVV